MISETWWRRGRDSNPRYAFTHNGFRDRPVQPLRHPSAKQGAAGQRSKTDGTRRERRALTSPSAAGVASAGCRGAIGAISRARATAPWPPPLSLGLKKRPWYKGRVITLPHPEAALPEVRVPESKAPESKAPESEAPSGGLPKIPLHRIAGPCDLLHLEPLRLAALVAAAERRYPRPAIALADRLSRRWLEKTANPYLGEIERVAAALGRPGAHFLNMSYEWACTTSVGPTCDGQANRLTRVLDWPFEGLGAEIVAAEQHGPAGRWVNLTWPGFTGCIQGHAPGRFAAAFNQAPLRRRSPVKALDWALDRFGLWRRGDLPPGHLLRRVFDIAPDFATARQMLAEAPLALPAIFSLVGPGPGEQAVIERLEDRAVIHDGPGAGHGVAANHWQGKGLPRARPRGNASARRAEVMRDEAKRAAADLAWLQPPVLNPTTRLALYAEPAGGRLVAQGFEADGPHRVAAATAITEFLA